MSSTTENISPARAPVIFSQTIEPFRAMVLDKYNRPLSLGTVRARHTFNGTLTGYYVELDDGTRMSVQPRQLAEPENIVAPPAAIWFRAAAPIPPGAA